MFQFLNSHSWLRTVTFLTSTEVGADPVVVLQDSEEKKNLAVNAEFLTLHRMQQIKLKSDWAKRILWPQMFIIKTFKENRFCLDVSIPPDAPEILTQQHCTETLGRRKVFSKVKKKQEPQKKRYKYFLKYFKFMNIIKTPYMLLFFKPQIPLCWLPGRLPQYKDANQLWWGHPRIKTRVNRKRF